MNNKYFYTAESIPFATEIGNEKFAYKDIDPETIDFLQELGFFIVINGGELTFTGTRQSTAKWILKELDEIAEHDDNLELSDYLRFNYNNYGENELLRQIEDAIVEIRTLQPYKTSYLDLIEHIIDDWYLSDNQKKQLQKEDADYYQEMQERTYQ